MNFLQKLALLYDIINSFHLNAFFLVDVFESVYFFAGLVLDDSDLSKGTLSY
jgi:hypothetical protein